jgi:class 3 adenylate cyclase
MIDIKSKLNYEENPETISKLNDFINNAKDEELFHIDIKKLSKDWNIEFKQLLELFIRGLHSGIFRMDWIFHCPHCGGIAHETLSIHNATAINYCGFCKVDFTNKVDDNIEVFFSIHPEIRKISDEFSENYKKFVLEKVYATKMYDWHTNSAIKGVDIIQNPVYRELMGDEVLLPDQSLELMKATILFTDIKGSTQMYSDLGDSKAFGLVREHFRILFEIIKKNNGIPVKTIGDAIMGAFTNQVEAISAALEAQKELISFYNKKPDNERIEVKIGLHTGPTIIVTLNNKLDYFGTTVNMAARIQAIANPKEIVISEKIFENKEVQKAIAKYTRKVLKSKNTFKGIEGEFNIYHIQFE